jgi:hypothetical protein
MSFSSLLIITYILFHILDRWLMVEYTVFDENEKLVDIQSFWTDASARRWFYLKGYNRPGYTLNRELHDEMIQVYPI